MERTCKSCGETKALDAYEVTTKDGKCRRGVCKPCYANAKATKAKAKAANHDRSSVPKPAACANCGKGPDEVDFKWRSDVQKGGWRTECNVCYNSKGYDKQHRKRQRAIDEKAFLARNAATHLAWAQRNPDKVKEQQRKTATMPERRIKVIKTSATMRNIYFEDAEMDAMEAKVLDACHYCGYKPAPGETINGLDRVDSNVGYTDINTVACCGVCNAMKGPLHVDMFIDNIRKIKTHALVGESILPSSHNQACRKLPPFARFSDRFADPEDKVDKTNELGDDVNIQLWSSDCYLCGCKPALGIDRVDPVRGYEHDNVRSCCSECNYMKKDLTLGDFMQHLSFVHAHTAYWLLTDVMDLPLVDWAKKKRTPVAVIMNDTPIIMFPSAINVYTLLGSSASRILKQVTPREYREYRAQTHNRNFVSILSSLRNR